MTFTGAEKRASVVYSQMLPGKLSLQVTASAPLDDDTKLAAFTAGNSLAAGFKAGFQLGCDERAAYWRSVSGSLAKLAQTRTKLGSLALAAQRQSYCAARELSPCQDSVIETALCTGGDCSEADFKTLAAEHAKPAWGATCDAHIKNLGGPAADWTDSTAVTCFRQAWAAEWLGQLTTYRAAVAEAARIYPIRGQLRTLAKRLLSDAQLQAATKTGLPLEDALFEDPGALAKAIDEIVDGPPLAVRDAFLTGVFDMPSGAHAIAFDFSAAFDRQKIYQDDVGGKASTESVADVEAGLSYTYYAPVRGLSLNTRLGYEYQRETKAKTFKRCVDLTSTSGTVAGTQCDEKALFRVGDQPAAEHAGYGRLALDYQYLGAPAKAKVIPGVELRLGIEGVGEDPELEGRIALYTTPVTGSNAARFGIAVDLNYDRTPSAADDEPRVEVTPLVFIGVSTSDLLRR